MTPSTTGVSLVVEYLWGALHPMLAKQLYECSSEELMNRAAKSTVWGFNFASALVDRVHDAGRMVRLQHERIAVLWTANKELKFGASQEVFTVAEYREKELQATVD
ncbi:hypothetical protein B296_00004173 [Ensete ventricosum]|uniref:Uncharacterized protein n=1 Tax=Ensete ventricosum TaxID=4639 RepID=A0A427BAM2_ENSVE|nr:hypothetical protein B296_00004173 [Ensete ventricosum]